MILNILLSARFSKLLLMLAVYFAPVKPLLVAAIVFTLCELITGVLAAIKKKMPITGSRIQKKIIALGVYLLAIILGFILESTLSDYIDFPVYKSIGFLILSTEFWSSMGNISTLTGLPINKAALMQWVDKLRQPKP